LHEEIKARWVAALREPDRVQGTGQLRDEEGRQCCLDVLCDLAVADGIISAPSLLPPSVTGLEYPVFGYADKYTVDYYQCEVLPKEVMEWAKLKDQNPAVDYNESFSDLSELNDEYHLSFTEIADTIEADRDI